MRKLDRGGVAKRYLVLPSKRLARLMYLLDFRDSDRSRLLDHLNSGDFNDGFDCWSDRRFQFPRRFLHWHGFGLGLGNRSLRRFRSLGLGHPTRLTALS